ncbi:hypothetical protein ACQPW1_10000 [Nocardia sp. CA-128927]|uniref:hypothetical protein n=1 Tax=Nocardia sp. CA-128927 TaxID=3239975 RepID=UPI003D983BF6
MDLLDFFRGELPWAKLIRFLRQLPDGSRYRAAQALDPGLAEHLLWLEENEPEGESPSSTKTLGPTSSAGYDLTARLLLTIGDLIQQNTATMVAINLPPKAQAPKVEPLPRPVSALDVLRAGRERDNLAVAMAELGF